LLIPCCATERLRGQVNPGELRLSPGVSWGFGSQPARIGVSLKAESGFPEEDDQPPPPARLTLLVAGIGRGSAPSGADIFRIGSVS